MTDPSSRTDGELRELADAYCAGRLSDEQRRCLTEKLRGDAANQRFFLAYLEVHAGLLWGFGGGGAAGLPAARPTPAGKSPRRRWLGVGFAAGLAASLALAVSLVGSRPGFSEGGPVATLTRVSDALWLGDAEVLAAGARLAPGQIELASGLAEVRMDSGAVLLLESPVRVDLRSATVVALHAGRLVTRVPPPLTEFVVETPPARIVDLGTEFGVRVDPSGAAVVQVYEGEVRTELKGTAAPPERQTAGESVQIDPAGKRADPVPFAADQFVRRFPEQNPHGKGMPYNRPQLDKVEVVPAPAGVAIDGDLSDWNKTGEFRSACDPPYADDYAVAGLMMYDDKFLYVGARVRDPAPLRNVIAPADGLNAWRGGAVQVRLSTDPRLPWPLDAESVPYQKQVLRKAVPVPPSTRLTHLTMWYHRPERTAALYVEYGMGQPPGVANPDGYRGAFRIDPDGRGYVLEYAVPWVVLNAGDNPPWAGDTTAACWLVHWSDEGGRVHRGHLLDVCNPAEVLRINDPKTLRGLTHVRAATWGQAVFRAGGSPPAVP